MRIIVKGKDGMTVYDSTKNPVILYFDENEKKIFGGLEKFVSAPPDSTVEERQRLIDTPIDCPHDSIERWNHGYHSRCRQCGERDV